MVLILVLILVLSMLTMLGAAEENGVEFSVCAVGNAQTLSWESEEAAVPEEASPDTVLLGDASENAESVFPVNAFESTDSVFPDSVPENAESAFPVNAFESTDSVFPDSVSENAESVSSVSVSENADLSGDEYEVSEIESPSQAKDESAEPAFVSSAEISDAPNNTMTENETPAVRYGIDYHLAGGENHPDNPESYTSADRVIFAAPTRTGYTFAGWYSDATYKKAITGIDEGSKNVKKVYAKWTANRYRVEFNGNGAVNTDGYGQNLVYDKPARLAANKYKRTGYTFIGWNTMPDGTGVSYKDRQEIKNLACESDKVITLYASWKINTYTISYSLNKGVNHPENPASYTVIDSVVLQAPQREGYTFEGWFTDSTLKKPFGGIGPETAKNIKVYAKWTAHAYQIRFIGNGALNPDEYSQKVVYDKAARLTACKYKRSGYMFTGWNTQPDGSGTSYKDKQEIKNITSIDGEVISLYACWKLNTYTISYSLNKGSNSPNNPSTYTVLDMPVLENPQKNGYTFEGWYTSNSYKKLFGGFQADTVGNLKLYAKWSANRCTVEFDGNGASNVAAYQQTIVYDKAARLTACKYKLAGYTFTGWNTMPDGSGTFYQDKQTIKNMSFENGSVLRLYACWKLNTYTVSYSLNKGTNNPENPLTYTVLDSIVLKDPQRNGYTFAGWYTDAALKKAFGGFQKNTAGNLKLYAKWNANHYSAEFNGNGAVNVDTYIQAFTYDKTATLTGCKFKRPGYTFTGWNTAPDGTGTTYKDRQSFKNVAEADETVIRLYASWKINTYTVSYALNKGTNSPENPSSYTVNDHVVLENPQREGFVFEGWFTDVNLKKPFAGFDEDAPRNIKLYAKWREKKFTFVFHGNGADNDGTYIQTGFCNASTALTANRFTSIKNVFQNWNTSPDGSGITLANKSKFTSYPGKDGDIIDLYAQWAPRMKPLTFNGAEFNVVNTALDAVTLANIVEGYICTSAGYPDYCLSFSYYYVSSMVNGISDLSPQQGSHGISKGLRYRTTESENPQTILSNLYDSLSTGVPQILMVKATNQKDRHFLAVVGYKSSVQDRDSIRATDLLVIDSHDGKLESMDPEIFPENTRVLHKQYGKYRMETVSKSVN